jgi:hypothetical protein
MLAGRDRDRRQFRHEVQNQRLILLGGESGVGKSSLLDAGLVPDLKAAGYTVVVCRSWGADVETDDEISSLMPFTRHSIRSCRRNSLKIRRSSRNLNAEFGDSLVIIFDQFEELLRYNRDRKANISQILLRIHQRFAVRMVLSFRSEYLHELKEIEAGAAPWDISRYLLNPVDEKYAPRVIANTRDHNIAAIESDVAAELAERWKAARADTSGASGAVSRVGMLHLQAMLYALHDRARGGTIDGQTFASMREDAAREGTSDAALFAFGLQRPSASNCGGVKPRRANSAWTPISYEARRPSSAGLCCILSSGGYKLVHEAGDLAKLVLDDEIEVCIDILDDGVERFEGDAKNDHDEPSAGCCWLSPTTLSAMSMTNSPPTSPMGSRCGGPADRHRCDLEGSAVTTGREGRRRTTRRRTFVVRAARSQPGRELTEQPGRRTHAWSFAGGGSDRGTPAVRVGARVAQGEQSRADHAARPALDGFADPRRLWRCPHRVGAVLPGARPRVGPLRPHRAGGRLSRVARRRCVEQRGREPATIGSELCGTADEPKVIANLCLKGNIILSARFANTVFVNCDFRQIKFQECSFEGSRSSIASSTGRCFRTPP